MFRAMLQFGYSHERLCEASWVEIIAHTAGVRVNQAAWRLYVRVMSPEAALRLRKEWK